MDRQRTVRAVLLAGAAIALFCGLFALLLEVGRHDLTEAGWAVAIAGPIIAVVLSFIASRLAV
jgi:hypothetical protein